MKVRDPRTIPVYASTVLQILRQALLGKDGVALEASGTPRPNEKRFFAFHKEVVVANRTSALP